MAPRGRLTDDWVVAGRWPRAGAARRRLSLLLAQTEDNNNKKIEEGARKWKGGGGDETAAELKMASLFGAGLSMRRYLLCSLLLGLILATASASSVIQDTQVLEPNMNDDPRSTFREQATAATPRFSQVADEINLVEPITNETGSLSFKTCFTTVAFYYFL